MQQIRTDATTGNETVEKLETQTKFSEILHAITDNNQLINQIESDVDALVQVIQTIGSDTEKVATTAESLHLTATQL